MLSFFNALPGAISQGLIWGIMAIGVYITYKVLDIADLTVDGSFCTGGAVFVVLLAGGVSLWLALLLLSAILLAAVGLLTLRWMNARKRRKHRAAQQEHMRRMAERRRLQEQYRIRQEYSQGPSAPESEQKQEDEKKPSDPESSDIEEL